MRIKPTSAYEKYVNLLLYNRNPPTFFGRLLWPFLGRCVYEGYITKTTTPMYKSLKMATKGDQNMRGLQPL